LHLSRDFRKTTHLHGIPHSNKSITDQGPLLSSVETQDDRRQVHRQLLYMDLNKLKVSQLLNATLYTGSNKDISIECRLA
jgi:hypothetical protein